MSEMRSVIREQGHERLIAAGRLAYESDGRPSGIQETWRLTAAGGGFLVLRVDVDGRAAGRRQSVLYHLVLAPDLTPERLKFRRLDEGSELAGDVLLSDGQASLSTTSALGRAESELTFADPGLVVPSVIELTLYWHLAYTRRSGRAILLRPDREGFALAAVDVSWGESLDGSGPDGRPCRQASLDVSGQNWTLDLDSYGLPLAVRGPGGLLVREMRPIRHLPDFVLGPRGE
jgi:hypothetical protein